MENLRIRDGWSTKIAKGVGDLVKYPTGFLKAMMPWNFIASNKPKEAIGPDGKPLALNSDEQAKAMLLGEKLYHSYRAGRFQFLKERDDYSDETAEMKTEYWKLATTEPAFASSLWTKIISVISNDVIIQPSSKQQRDKDLADWVKECLLRSKGGIRKIGQEIFYHGLVRGNVLCEPKWVVKNSLKWSHLFPHGYWTLNDFIAKDPSDYRLEEDGFRNITGVWSTRTNQWFPLSYFTFWANRPVYSNQAGVSEARSVRRAANLIKLAHTYRGIYLEQFGLPVLKGTYARGDDTAYALAYTALQKARSMGFILMPDGSDVEALTLAQRGQSDYGEAIDDYRKEIFLAVTGSYLYAMEGSVGNAAGNSETHRSTLDLAVWYLAKILEELLNEQIIPWLVSLNTYDMEPPLAQIGGVQDSDLKASMEIDTSLFNMGVPLDPDELYERYKRTPPKDLAKAIKKSDAVQPVTSEGKVSGGLPTFADKKKESLAQTTNYTCGTVSLLWALQQLGQGDGLSEAGLAVEIGTSEDDGTSASAIQRGLTSHGVNAEGRLGMSLSELANRVAQGALVITSVQLKDAPEKSKQANKEGHWVVVKDVDPEEGTVTYFEPSGGEIVTVPAQQFSSDWHDIDASGRILSRYGIIVTPKDEESASFADGGEAKKKAWIGCNLPPAKASLITALSSKIADEHLAGKGRVEEPHMTLFYGCDDGSLPTVQNITNDATPLRFTIGGLMTFDSVVDGVVPLVAKVYSVAAEELNAKLAAEMPEVEQKFDKYVPHITLAYMAEDAAKAYLRDKNFSMALAGESGLIDTVVFNSSTNQATELPLASPGMLGTSKFAEPVSDAAAAAHAIDRKDAHEIDTGMSDSVLASDKKKVNAPTDEVAIAGADGKEVARLLRKAKEAGALTLCDISRPAVERLLQGRTWSAGKLFSNEEREVFVESLIDSITPADMLGRSRVWLRYHRDEASTAEPTKFSDSTPFVAEFADSIGPLKPEKAIDYFKRLIPKLGTDVERLADGVRRSAFTMAEATEASLLKKVQKIIADSLTTGTPRGDIQINDVLDRAGVLPKNPQYAEMVYRTNMMDSFNQAQDEEMARPVIQDAFPVWRYDGIDDERAGEDHEPHFGNYYSSSTPFATVRGARVYNCRCSPRMLHRSEWEKLLAGGASLTIHAG